MFIWNWVDSMYLEDAYWCRTDPNKKYLDKKYKVEYNYVKSWNRFIQLFHHVMLQNLQITVFIHVLIYGEVLSFTPAPQLAAVKLLT